MNEKLYPEGIDCVWLASDREGHLGAFVTGGIAPIPTYWLNSENMQIEDVEGSVCELPNASAVRMLIEIKRPDDFIEMASKGIFVYDWRDIHRTSDRCNTYELVAAPLTPITIDGLSGDLADMAKSLLFGDVAFVDGQPLDVCKYTSCRDGEGCF